MKKLWVLLLSILLCLPVCFPAFADMMGPEIVFYKITVKAGTPYYESEWNDETHELIYKQAGTFDEDTELTIENEDETGGMLFGSFYLKKKNGSGEAFSGYVRLDNLNMVDRGVYPASAGYKQSVPVRLRVMDPKGVTLYAGPSLTYAKVGVIPQGTELTVDTIDQQDYASGEWMYITYGGKSGWSPCWLYSGQYCPMAELLPNNGTGTVWVVKDNAWLKDRDGNNVIQVSKGEKLTFDSFNRYPHSFLYYVNYQGKSGYFESNDDGGANVIASNRNYASYLNMNVKKDFTTLLYSYPEELRSVGTVSYKQGDTMRGEFLFYGDPPKDSRGGTEWFYVEKDGQKGWIKPDPEIVDIPAPFDENITGDIPHLYDSESTPPTETMTVTQPTAAQTTTAAQTATALPTDAQRNAVQTAAAVDTPQADDTDAPLQTGETTEPAFTVWFETTEPSTEKAVPASSGRVLSPTGFIGVCVAAAVILALTALVTLSLIRRKKGS